MTLATVFPASVRVLRPSCQLGLLHRTLFVNFTIRCIHIAKLHSLDEFASVQCLVYNIASCKSICAWQRRHVNVCRTINFQLLAITYGFLYGDARSGRQDFDTKILFTLILSFISLQVRKSEPNGRRYSG